VRRKLIILFIVVSSLSFLLAVALGAEISTISLTSSSKMNLSSDNITVSYTATGANTVIADWRRNATSIAVLNLPFDVNISDNTSGAVRDYSTYGHNGTLGDGILADMPVWTDSCIVGGCYVFDGGYDEIRFPDIMPTNAYTKMAWVKVESNSSYNNIISSHNGGGSHAFYVHYLTLLAGHDTNYSVVSGAETLVQDVWYHVAVTFDSATGEMILYLDGTEVNKSTAANITMTAVLIGNHDNDHALDGSLDEVYLFDEVLSAEQIDAFYQAGLFETTLETLLSQETKTGDVWSVALTPINNSDVVEGTTMLSNNLTIVSHNFLNIQFEDPTPEDNKITSTFDSERINISMKSSSDLTSFTWNWNAANYTFYDDSLLLLLNFDNRTSLGEHDGVVYDASLYQNHGTVINASWMSDGVYEGGYEFDGATTYIDLPTENFDSLGDITVSLWMKFNGQVQWDRILHKGDSDRNTDAFGFTQSGSTVVGYVQPKTTGQYSRFMGESLVHGAWYHVVMVYNQTSHDVNMYLNGQLSNGETVSSTLYAYNGNHFNIGKRSGGENYFDGVLDQIMIWNRSLSAAEIQELYTSHLYKYNETQWYFTTNKSGLNQGSYSYYAYAENLRNYTQTEIRTMELMRPPEPINECQNIDTSDMYHLTTDLESNATCIEITASDVVLDCQGYTITYSLSGESATRGIRVNGHNVTIKNCHILDGNWSGQSGRQGVSFGSSMRYSVFYNNTVNVSNGRALAMDGGSNYNTVSNNVIWSNTGFAAYLSSISHNIFFNNTFRSVNYDAIVQWFGTNNTFERNFIQADDQGLMFDGMTLAVIKSNTILTDNDFGIAVQNNANDALVYNNTVNSTGGYGIYARSVTGINITSNIVHTNTTSAIYALDAPDIIIADNVVNSTTGYGVHVVASLNALIMRNDAVSGSRGMSLHYHSGLGNYTVIDNVIKSTGSQGLYIQSLMNSGIYRNNIIGTWAGLYIRTNANNNTFINNTATGTGSGQGAGLEMRDSHNNTFITNDFIDSRQGIQLYHYGTGISGHLFINNTATASGSNAQAIQLAGTYNIRFIGQTATTSNTTGSNTAALYIISDTTNTYFQDSFFSGELFDVYLGDVAINTTFVNVTYNISKENVAGINSELFRKWWFGGEVVDSSGLPLRDVAISVFNSSGDQALALFTDANGLVERSSLTEYVNVNNTRAYQNNFELFISKSDYVDFNTTFNLSAEENFFETFVLSRVSINPWYDEFKSKRRLQQVVNDSVLFNASFVARYVDNVSMNGSARLAIQVLYFNETNSSEVYFEVFPLENISTNFSEIVVQVPLAMFVEGNYSNATRFVVGLHQNDSSVIELNTSIVSRNGTVFLQFTSQKLGEFFVNTVPVLAQEEELVYVEESVYGVHPYSSSEGVQNRLLSYYEFALLALLFFLVVSIFVVPPKRAVFVFILFLLLAVFIASFFAVFYIPPLV